MSTGTSAVKRGAVRADARGNETRVLAGPRKQPRHEASANGEGARARVCANTRTRDTRGYASADVELREGGRCAEVEGNRRDRRELETRARGLCARNYWAWSLSLCVCVSPRRIYAGDAANGLYGPERGGLGHATRASLTSGCVRNRTQPSIQNTGLKILILYLARLVMLGCGVRLGAFRPK